MASPNATAGTSARAAERGRVGIARRVTAETKKAFKTTEFWSFVAVCVAILISAAVINGGDNGTDEFIARNAWLYVSIITAGYLISRGLAKAGNYAEDRDGDRDGGR
jgi:uncharacterized membrane protein YcjF (UPF0283 family)